MRFHDLESNGIRGWKGAGPRIAPLFVVMMAASLASGGQSIPFESAGFRNFDPRAVASSARLAPAHILREIRDPHTGIRWLLLPNGAASGGPAQMVAATGSEPSGVRGQAGRKPPPFAIHQGDRVVVEEHTRAVEAYLEAVALGPALAGSVLDVRLKIGNKVVRAVAIAPGRAALLPPTGVKR